MYFYFSISEDNLIIMSFKQRTVTAQITLAALKRSIMTEVIHLIILLWEPRPFAELYSVPCERLKCTLKLVLKVINA